MWSEKHQRPYFYNKKTKKTAWKGHQSTGQRYDELPCAKTGRLEVALMSVREHNRFVKRGLMWHAMVLAAGKWHDLEQLKALGMSQSLFYMEEKPALRVLDVGCGDGSDLHRWTFDDRERWVTAVHGIDVSPKCIAAAQKNATEWRGIMGFSKDVEIEYRTHDARKRDAWSQGQPYDVVSCMHCLPYFFSSQKVAKAFFARAAEACRSGAALLAIYPAEKELATHLWGIGKDRMHVALPQWHDMRTNATKPRSAGARPPLPYTLSLPGAVPRTVVEHTVPEAALLQVLREANWRVVLHKNVQGYANAQGLWRLPYTDAYASSKTNNVLLCVKMG